MGKLFYMKNEIPFRGKLTTLKLKEKVNIK